MTWQSLSLRTLCWATEHFIQQQFLAAPSSHYGTCILAPPPRPSNAFFSSKHDTGTGPSFVIPRHLHIRLARIPTRARPSLHCCFRDTKSGVIF